MWDQKKKIKKGRMMIEALRTPEHRFAVLPNFPYRPNYVDDLPSFEGLRMHYVDEVQVEHIAASTDTPEEKIRQIVQLYLAHFQAHPQSFQLIQRAVNENSPAAQALAQRWYSRAFAAFHTITTDGVQHGLFKPLPPPLMSFAIVGLLEQAIRFHKLAGDMSPDLSGAYLFDELADLIVALLRADTPRSRVPVHRGKKRPPSKKPRSTS